MTQKDYKTQPVVTLNNGLNIPALGFGVWQIEDQELCENSVKTAIEVGYKMIDTAAIYQNEKAVGEAIKKGGVDRESLFITSKLWVQDAGYESAKLAFQRTLDRLQLDYLDLYLIHWPFGDILGSWKAMEELYKEGKIKAIGVSNFPIEKLKELEAVATVTPAVNQVELHPIFQQKELRAYHAKHNIVTQPWSPLGQGNDELFNQKDLKAIADKYGKTVPQVIIRWHLQEGFVVFPKSATPARIKSNFEVFDFELTEEELNQVRALDTNERLFFDPSDPAWEEKVLGMIVDI